MLLSPHQGLRCRMEEKKTTKKQNRTPRQSKTEKRRKTLLSGGNSISEVVARGIPEVRGVVFHRVG